MFILGLQGSPRRRANTHDLLTVFVDAAAGLGARTRVVEVCRQDIRPCIGCGKCEKNGLCVQRDDMSKDIFGLLREADAVVLATPIYFYNATAQLKALIDRSQTLWSRRYRLKLRDPGSPTRRGMVLALAATGGKNLFEGLNLTAQYFFDAIHARDAGSLSYRGIENPGDLLSQPAVRPEVEKAAADLMQPFVRRRRILFAGRGNACRSQMAAGFARLHGGDRLAVASGGNQPAARVDPQMVAAMAAKGIDLGFARPQGIEQALAGGAPELVVALDGGPCPRAAGARRIRWDLPDPAGGPPEGMELVRNEIEARVGRLLETI